MRNLYPILFLLAFTGTMHGQSSSISPSDGTPGQSLPVIISGQNVQYSAQGSNTVGVFLQGQNTGNFIGPGTNTGFTQLQVLGPTSISGVLVLPGSATIDTYDMVVVAGTQTFDNSAFEIKMPAGNNLSMSTNASQPGKTHPNVVTTVAGGNFKSAALSGNIGAVWLSNGTDIIEAFQTVSVISSNQFRSDIVIPANANFGMYDVNVYTNTGEMYVIAQYFEIDSDVSLREKSNVSFSYYPNPAQQELTVEYQGQGQSLEFYLSDLQGRKVSKNLKVDGVNTKAQFNLTDLAKGSYILHVLQDGQHITSKQWVKQ